MRITMQKAESLTLEQMWEFLAASEELDLALARRTEIYDLVERTLRKQRYLELTNRGMHLTPETPTYSMRGCGGLPADAGGV